MNGQIDEQIDGWINEWIDRWMDRYIGIEHTSSVMSSSYIRWPLHLLHLSFVFTKSPTIRQHDIT